MNFKFPWPDWMPFAVAIIATIGLVANGIHTKKNLKECKKDLDTARWETMVQKEILEMPIHNASITAKKILKLQPNLDEGVADWYGFIINAECPIKLHNVLISIIFAESSFDHLKRNGTGDYGLGQINYRVWGQFFGVTKNDLLNPIVNIKLATTILQMAKVSHGKKADWYAYYHSWNHTPRQVYKQKIDKILAKIDTCASGTCEINYDGKTIQE